MKVKEEANKAFTSAKRVVLNAEQFIQAVSLLTVAAFSYYSLGRIELDTYAHYLITFALVVIGLRGFYEMVKFLDKEK